MRADAQQAVPLVTNGVAVSRDEGGGVIGHDWLASKVPPSETLLL